MTYLKERSVDPRDLAAAAQQAAKHREVDVVSGSEVLQVLLANGRATGVKHARTTYPAAAVVNAPARGPGTFRHTSSPLAR